MKKFTKMFCTLLMATLLVLTGFAHTVSAGASDKATVTINNVEEGAKVTLYKVVKANYDSGDNFEGYGFVDGGLISPKQIVVVTKQGGTDTKGIVAGDLDVDKDLVVDATYTDGTDTYDVDTAAAGKVLYDYERPTQESIMRVVADDLYEAYGAAKVASKDYVQFEVEAGQYIALIDSSTIPGAGDTVNPSIYSPVVVSAGYTNINTYKTDDAGTFYKLKNGNYTDTDPTTDTEHLYASTTQKYSKDSATTEQKLVAVDLDLKDDAGNFIKYDWTLEGNSAAAKRQDAPDIKKEVEPSTQVGTEEVEVKIVAVGEDSNALKDASDNLLYIHKKFTVEDYMKVLSAVPQTAGAAADTIKFKEDSNGKYVQDDAAGTLTKQEALIAMTTANETLALTKPKTIFTAGSGAEINYKLTPTIPSYPDTARNKILSVADKMSDSIDFQPDSIKLSFRSGLEVVKVENTADKEYTYYVKVKDAFDATTDSGFIDYNDTAGNFPSSAYGHDLQGAYLNNSYEVLTVANVASYTGPVYRLLAKAYIPANPNDFQVNLIYESIPGETGSKESPVITYTGKLNDKAVSGIEGATNVAKFYYSNTPGTDDDWDPTTTTPPSGQKIVTTGDPVTVYSYEVSFRKTNDKDEFIEETSSTPATEKRYLMVTGNMDPKSITVSDPITPAQQAQIDAAVALRDYVYEKGKAMYRKESAEPVWFLEEANVGTHTADVKASPKYVVNPQFEVLKGAEFGLYRDPECTDLVFTLTTNENGIAMADDEQQKLLKTGLYYLKEIKAPEGYALSNIITPVQVDWTKAIKTTKSKTTTYDYTAIQAVAKDPAQVGWLVGEGAAVFKEMSEYDLTEWESLVSTNPKVPLVHNGTTYEVEVAVIDGKPVFKAYLLRDSISESTSIDEFTNANGGGTVLVGRINNTKTSELPSTGGIGTYMFTIAGVAILSLAAFMLVFRKKEARQ